MRTSDPQIAPSTTNSLLRRQSNTSSHEQSEQVVPRIFTFQQSTNWDREGYPIFVKRRESQQATYLHEHVYHEIVLVESGTADHISAEGVRKLHSGDLLVIKPRIWHQYENPKHFGIVNCLFDRRILMHQKVFLSLIGGAFELFLKPPRQPATTPPSILHASPSQRLRITDILNAMVRERREKLIDWEGALAVHLLDLIVTISRIYHGANPGERPPLTDKARDFVNGIVVYLESQSHKKITLSELSKKFHTSESYLSRLFSKRMGMGIIDYIHHLRIEAACELLRTSDWSVSRVASEVGYDEIPYFCRRFRREIGKSPKEYRTSALL